MRNTWLTIIEYVDRFLQLLGFRRQRELGVIYDSVTKQPVDPVIVKLIDARTVQVVASTIANINGEYGFIADPGVYQIYLHRPHYEFPSQKITGLRDGIYYPVYHGQPFEFSGGEDVISMNIPLDPVAADWNQEAKKVSMRKHPMLEQGLRVVARLLFWATLLLVVWNYAMVRTQTWLVVGSVYAFIILFALCTPRVRLWGRVRLKHGRVPVAGATVAVSHATLPDITIGRATTTSSGKFFIRLGAGTYTVTVTPSAVSDEAPQEPKHFTVHIGPAGVLNRELYI